ncbi:MAG: hypothetical protein V1645_04635 [archaeon]
MCSLCGNTGAEHTLLAIGPQLLTIFLARIKGAAKGLKNKIQKKK